ncbi:uncharacterized protein J4E87_001513 [Alternaria ethzedia]|uniref:uncharacterized protein n=1 Tax=Alternaria ethzedia TaxID=181014 RepID=UPI0020C4D2E5|nr:uncharacterized protein J4E87_001513 [Alternaria ethzedia]KAI4632043.1 hypothetical protein J4E87_001513 [Alternaria ethzedia]
MGSRLRYCLFGIRKMAHETPWLWDVGGDVDDFSDDDDGLHLDLNTDLIGVNRTTKDLNIVNAYRPKWTCVEAFRESYQNWRDGILRSFDLDQSRFQPTYTEKGQEIIIEARHPDNDNLLGYIHFKGDKDGNCVGGLKVVNFEATLRFSDLGTGSTSKARDPRQTGQHGDGMKISSLVYRRNGYNLRYESGGFAWRYIYKKGGLACSLSRINEKNLKKIKDKDKGKPRTHRHHAWEDVCLVIADTGKTKDIRGWEAHGKQLNIVDFKKWIIVTLDINPPKDIIRTIHGDLIRDPSYQARMYLRGLSLPRGGKQGDKYAYGYNFNVGNTSADRDALSGSAEESDGITAIWSAAIRADGSTDSDLLSDYTKLLLGSISKNGDVMMFTNDDGSESMPRDIAKKVWEKMLTLNMDAEGQAAFYYSASEGNNEAHVIGENLRKSPTPIHPDLWRILRKYSLCRTPREELLHRFESAEVVSSGPDTVFATSMRTMLQCLLLSSPATQEMELTFVDGEHLNIDAGFFSGTWKVHSKWLTWEGAHEQAFCEEDESGTFSCDHAVLQLWDIMISQLIATGEHPRIATEERWLKSMARIRLSQMPRSVECRQTQNKGELMVTWESTDSHRHKHKTVKVILHWGGCDLVGTLDENCLNHDGSVESGPRPTTADAIDPRNNDQTPYVDEDDEMEDNADLYRSPISGTKVEHKSLDWGGSFPGSHDFYRTRDEPDQEIYILKPKISTMKPRNKRMLSGATERGGAKRLRTNIVANREDSSASNKISGGELEDGSDTDSRPSPFLRRGESAMTLRPERRMNYREGHPGQGMRW